MLDFIHSMVIPTLICAIFASVLGVASLSVALVALRNAEKGVRETKIRAGVAQLAADFAALQDSVDGIAVSVRKIRNRQNAAHARESKTNGAAESDEEFLRRVQLDAMRKSQNG